MPVIGVTPEKPRTGIKPIIVLRIIQTVVILSVGLGGYGIYQITNVYADLQKQADTLSYLSIYSDARNSVKAGIGSTNSDQKNQFLKDLQQKETVFDVIKLNAVAEDQYAQTKTYEESTQAPYQYFLQYFLLPPLNIWKDKFTGKIDETIIGQKYLIENNYLDVNLISKWTDFFKDIGKDSPKNEIKNINISDITEGSDNIFTMTIDLGFVAETKRSFLLLVDKLSLTSNRENLGLLNEFFFNLWTIIRDKSNVGGVSTVSGSVVGTGVVVGTGLLDEDIGNNLYKWVLDPSSTYINDKDIVRAIRRMANCETEDMQACYFKFREKTRTIPLLAYTVGLPNTNKSNELRSFIQNLPPLINVKQFVFKKAASGNSKDGNKPYEGNLTIDVYGKSITAEDVGQIAEYLGNECTEGNVMSPGAAVTQLEKTIRQATIITQISNEKSEQLNELKNEFINISTVFDGLPGFKKIVKLFEIYRMLFDNRLCSKK